jgi:aryl carrier-like protein
MSAALAHSFFDRFGGAVELRNMYGPTEAVLTATWWRCQPSDEGTIPIGRPIANTQVYVLDERLRPVPLGAPGELCIGGVQVARGYINQPALTAERFVANPFRPGERIYRTGDIARQRSDGAVEFLGRRDHQVKIRGVRVEVGEVEAALATHPAVARAVVAPWDDRDGGGQQLVAYVVLEGAAAIGLGQLRAHLHSRLPDYMVPAAFITLATLPLTANGKVDRRALPAPDAGRLGVEAEFVAPRTEVESTLAAIWAQLLRVEQVGTSDNFFELGGDSIIAIRVVVRANRAGLRLSPAQVFEHQTVAGLAAAASDLADSAGYETALMGTAQKPRGERLTPSDFPLADLDQATLDRLLG